MLSDLLQNLISAGLPAVGVSTNVPDEHGGQSLMVRTGDAVRLRVDFAAALTAPQAAQAMSIAAAWSTPPTAAEQLDAIGGRLAMALAFRLSSSWASATAAERAAAQTIIDAAGAGTQAVLAAAI